MAAGIVPFASATDEGGSIRVPASYCGLFGLKPSRGRNPVGPDFDEEWDGMSQSHVITRSVRDSAAMLDAVSGFENGAPYGIFTKERPFIEEVDTTPGKLRIAFFMRSAYGKNVHPECVRAVEKACALLGELGHEVVEAEPDFREEDAALCYSIIVMGNAAALVGKLIRLHGQSLVKRDLEVATFTMYRMGRSLHALDFVKAKRRWREFGTIMDRMLNRYDVVLTPTLGEPPVSVGSQQPCGVQFIGRYGDEAKLLRLAGQLEKAQPWVGRKPPILP